MSDPTISVIIPAYNAAATITAALASVRAQTRPPAEVIVVDDGSRDATAAIVEAFIARASGPPVTLLRQANRGCGQARNTGAAAARGDWLGFLDADDTWLPGKLAAQAPLTADARVGVVNCAARDRAGRPMGRTLGFDQLWESNDLVVSSSLVRRTAFEAVGGFWAGRACEDYHLWLRLTAAGWTVANWPEDLVVYSPAPGSLSQQIASFAAAEFACLRDVAAQAGIGRPRLRARLVAGHLKHLRGAIHHRDLRLARRLAWQSLAFGVSPRQLAMLGLACVPARLLDARRRWVGAQAVVGTATGRA